MLSTSLIVHRMTMRTTVTWSRSQVPSIAFRTFGLHPETDEDNEGSQTSVKTNQFPLEGAAGRGGRVVQLKDISHRTYVGFILPFSATISFFNVVSRPSLLTSTSTLLNGNPFAPPRQRSWPRLPAHECSEDKKNGLWKMTRKKVTQASSAPQEVDALRNQCTV